MARRTRSFFELQDVVLDYRVDGMSGAKWYLLPPDTALLYQAYIDVGRTKQGGARHRTQGYSAPQQLPVAGRDELH
jgi:hypothetical protein